LSTDFDHSSMTTPGKHQCTTSQCYWEGNRGFGIVLALHTDFIVYSAMESKPEKRCAPYICSCKKTMATIIIIVKLYTKYAYKCTD